jgi:hypothetical protein
METEQIIWQFKDSTLTRPELDQFLGATIDRWASGTVLRLRCVRATRDAKKKAAEINQRGQITVVIEEEGQA